MAMFDAMSKEDVGIQRRHTRLESEHVRIAYPSKSQTAWRPTSCSRDGRPINLYSMRAAQAAIQDRKWTTKSRSGESRRSLSDLGLNFTIAIKPRTPFNEHTCGRTF